MSTELRTPIFAATRAAARADSQITNQEEQALRVVADALQLGETDDPATGNGLPAGSTGLDQQERELVYAYAAWLASADSVNDTAETELLRSPRAVLDLEPDAAAAAQSKVDALRVERTRYLPRSEERSRPTARHRGSRASNARHISSCYCSNLATHADTACLGSGCNVRAPSHDSWAVSGESCGRLPGPY